LGPKKEPSNRFAKFLGGPPNRHKLDLSKVTPTIVEFAGRSGVVFLNEVTTDLLDEDRQSWKLKPTTYDKQTERLKSFFKFLCGAKVHH